MPVTGLIGRKLGMTQIFTPEGEWIPVTVVACGPCRIVQIRTRERDGYEAVQLGFQEAKEKHLNRPLLGHFRKAGVPGYRYLHEFRGPVEGLEVGQEVTVSIFEKGDRVDVTGITKGPVPFLPGSLRTSACLDTWAMFAGRSRTWKWWRCGRKNTSCWSGGRFPVPGGPFCGSENR